MMSGWEIVGLAGAALLGGAINAVAGGGTLVTFPSLLACGISPLAANATSTLALVVGTSGGTYGNRQHLEAVKPWLKRFLLVSLLGGLAGSVLLTHTSNETFSKMVPFLILFATVLFLTQGLFKRFATSGGRPMSIRGAIIFQFFVAIYGGYFGAGAGILMLATFGFIGIKDIFEMNTLKTILGSLFNLVAALWFIGAGLIDWPAAAIMTVGAIGGYFLGAHYSHRISQQRVRQIVTAVGFLISAITFYKEFLQHKG